MTNEIARKPSVLVMMATYNGEKYVAEQIDSILAQEGVNVTLLISDDARVIVRRRFAAVMPRYA